MKSIKLLKNKSIKYTWVATYITLFLMPLIISTAIFFMTDRTLKTEINKSNYFLLKQVQQYMDSLVNDIEKQAITLALDEKVQVIRGMEGNRNY